MKMRKRGTSGRDALGVMGFAWLALAGLAGCSVVSERRAADLEALFGNNTPLFEAAYAAREIPPRSAWRIYLRGADPDGDLHFIQIFMDVPWGSTAVRLEIDPDQARVLSGYLTFDTLEFLEFSPPWVRLLIALEDRAGHRSEPVVLTATFSARSQQGKPPPSTFEERFLGRIPAERIPGPFGPGI